MSLLSLQSTPIRLSPLTSFSRLLQSLVAANFKRLLFIKSLLPLSSSLFPPQILQNLVPHDKHKDKEAGPRRQPTYIPSTHPFFLETSLCIMQDPWTMER